MIPATNEGQCNDDEHDWELREDEEGDPGVINGTQVIRWYECSVCGTCKDWDGEYPDYDDYSDAEFYPEEE